MRHYSGGVYGNLAYGLERELREKELQHAGEVRRERTVPKTETKVRSLPRVRVRERERVSLLSVAGCFAVAVMAVMVLFSYVQLTAKYQQMYDLSTVKEVAVQAGMSKPGSSQIYYVDLSDGDSAAVYQKEDPGILTKIAAAVRHSAASVKEYFG